MPPETRLKPGKRADIPGLQYEKKSQGVDPNSREPRQDRQIAICALLEFRKPGLEVRRDRKALCAEMLNEANQQSGATITTRLTNVARRIKPEPPSTRS